MRLLLPTSVSLLLAWQAVRGQTAEDFFNGGAQFYISNNIPSALEKVEGGLKMYPGDQKLKKLEELLKQQQSQQNQQNQNQENQSQQNSNDQQKQQDQQLSQKNSQDQQKQNQSGEKKDEAQKQPEQQKSSAGKKDAGKREDQNAEGRPVAPGEMTPEEAKRLLDAQKSNEQVLQLKPQGKPENQNRTIKDW